jgi:hypothetical protein
MEHRAPLRLLRRHAAAACRLHGMPPVTIIVRAYTDSGGSYLDNAIGLDSRDGQNLLSLAHELAHHFTQHKHPHAQDHGPAFVRWYAHFLDAWRLIPIEGTIAACRRYGVAIAPVLVSTP